MIGLYGTVVSGAGHFSQRMNNHAKVFHNATGEILYPGTLNVDLNIDVPIIEHFRIRGHEIGEPLYDFLFEICKANDLWAYRIKPLNLLTGKGGHGDNIIEIICSQKIPNSAVGEKIKISFFR